MKVSCYLTAKKDWAFHFVKQWWWLWGQKRPEFHPFLHSERKYAKATSEHTIYNKKLYQSFLEIVLWISSWFEKKPHRILLELFASKVNIKQSRNLCKKFSRSWCSVIIFFVLRVVSSKAFSCSSLQRAPTTGPLTHLLSPPNFSLSHHFLDTVVETKKKRLMICLEVGTKFETTSILAFF